VNVVLRHCPECGGPLTGRRGIPWMACGECPLAVDPFASPTERLVTWRPDHETGEAALRLAFYLFDVGPQESVHGIWIPAFRSSGRGAHKAAAALTTMRHLPPLVAAPLGAVLGRTPVEAATLVQLQLPHKSRGDAEIPSPRLVSLPAQSVKGRLVEPVSGVAIAL
jgi:hypothetical protein